MQVAHTLDTQLNVFAGFDPVLSPGARESRVTFLANIQPDLQRRVREQCTGAVVTGLDSMNYWIESARDSLLETIGCVDVVSLNDTEVRMLTGEPNLARAARQICAARPARRSSSSRGSYGACMFTQSGFFFVPGYPLETVVDPTGAGDSFAGGFFGYLDAHLEATRAHGRRAPRAQRSTARWSRRSRSRPSAASGCSGSRCPRSTTASREFKQMTHFEAQPLLVRARER